MSVDWLFLIPVPPAVLASDEYLDVDDDSRGDDYVIELGGRWDPRVVTNRVRRRKMALELARTHLTALRRVKPPREIVVTTDAAAPADRDRKYANVRKRWLAAGAFVLPDVVDGLISAERAAAAIPPLQPSDVRIPLPPGTRRARLRRLDPTFALGELRGSGRVEPADVECVRAGVVLVDVVGQDFNAIAQHYRAALRALEIRMHEDKPSKWIEERFVQLRGSGEHVEVSITARPAADGGLAIGVLWVERMVTPKTPRAPIRSSAAREPTRRRAR